MKSNNDKCHLIIINNEDNIIKLLGVTIDNKLHFNEHVTNYKKDNQKFYALKRIAKYLDSNKLRMLMKAFIESQFNY